jgi:hypothetical protein
MEVGEISLDIEAIEYEGDIILVPELFYYWVCL